MGDSDTEARRRAGERFDRVLGGDALRQPGVPAGRRGARGLHRSRAVTEHAECDRRARDGVDRHVGNERGGVPCAAASRIRCRHHSTGGRRGYAQRFGRTRDAVERVVGELLRQVPFVGARRLGRRVDVVDEALAGALIDPDTQRLERAREARHDPRAVTVGGQNERLPGAPAPSWIRRHKCVALVTGDAEVRPTRNGRQLTGRDAVDQRPGPCLRPAGGVAGRQHVPV